MSFRGTIGRYSHRILLAAAILLACLPVHAQLPLNQRVLVVYNSSQSASLAVANHYVAQRSIPSANLCAINPPSTTTLTWSQYVATIKTPIRNCLNTVGPTNILYIVFTYLTPYIVTGSTSPLYFAIDQYVADIWDQYASQDFYPAPTQFHPYYDDAQSQGNVYQPFVSFATYRAQPSSLLIYSVWRLDGASQALAQGLVDNAIYAETTGLAGQACIDRNRGPITNVLDSDYGEGDWDLHQAATFAGQAGFTVIEDPNSAEFGTAPAPLSCPNAALYSGWYSLNHYNSAFTWNPGAIGIHLDSASAVNPRGGTNWSANAIINGITVTTGSVAEPYLEGLVRPGGTLRDLFQGANLGDAFLRNTRWLKWMILYFGDPLYRPFPGGLSPFNPPLPQYSLALSSRYVLNGGTSTGAVTLANPAPTGGLLVNLTSSTPSLATVPASVNVPAGSTTAPFTITTASTPPVTSDTAVRITASGVGQNALTVSPLLGGIFLSPAVIIGGAPANGLILLNGNAPSGGTSVSLTSSSTLTAPATVTVPAGQSQAGFTITSSFVTSSVTATITATSLGTTSKANLTLAPALTSMSVSPTSAPGGSAATLSIYLGAFAPSGGWLVDLSSNNPSVASLPSSVIVPAGTRFKQVPVSSTPQCSNVSVTLIASSGASTLNTGFTVTPPSLSSLSFASSVKGGTPVTATVTVSNPVCSMGLSVSLQSSNPLVASVPPSVVVPAGQKSATFTITTYAVPTTTSVTISATSNGVAKSRALTVTP
jgi:uncharacterized protein (TIGR03790 family)